MLNLHSKYSMLNLHLVNSFHLNHGPGEKKSLKSSNVRKQEEGLWVGWQERWALLRLAESTQSLQNLKVAEVRDLSICAGGTLTLARAHKHADNSRDCGNCSVCENTDSVCECRSKRPASTVTMCSPAGPCIRWRAVCRSTPSIGECSGPASLIAISIADHHLRDALATLHAQACADQKCVCLPRSICNEPRGTS